MTSPKRILIADDDPVVLLVLSHALQRLGGGYEIITAGDGDQALQECRQAPFDLLISDIRMPGMDGIELLEAIRAQNHQTAVIWITAFNTHKLQCACERLKVHCCLNKPLRIHQIRQVALEALGDDPLERSIS